MSAKKCNNCGEVVLPYYDKTTGDKKCPKCEAFIQSSIKMPVEIPSNISREVVIKDIHMPFWSMVAFMVKWAIASIPAIIILTLITIFSISIFSGIIQGLSKGVQ